MWIDNTEFDEWSIYLNSVSINGDVLFQDIKALVDSGSSYIMVPFDDFYTLQSAIERESGRSCWQ